MAGRWSGLLCGRLRQDRAHHGRAGRYHTTREDLHPELRSRVRAAAGQAAEVEVIPDGAGYRISAVSGDTAVEMYLEMRPDGSVEERTQLRERSTRTSPEKTATSRPNAINLEKRSDQELLHGLGTALADVVTLGQADRVGLREAWQRVVEGIRDLERRYPPEAQESA